MTITARDPSPRLGGEKLTILRCDYDRLLIELKACDAAIRPRARTGRRLAPRAMTERGTALAPSHFSCPADGGTTTCRALGFSVFAHGS
ncbi:hypothetical protein [Trinickia sp.]|uniref:hypothetical protein n=1 Tax=Trinickia sp. TaxID=2571163 RepID=UPI003F7DA9D8